MMRTGRNRKQLLPILDIVTAVSTRVTGLVRCNKFAEVESLLVRLPHTRAYQDNEEITRAKIALAWHKRDVQTVYKLIEEGKFSNGEDLIVIWDQAHAYEAKARTPVQRYRLRQRFMPPRSICPSGIRKKRGIPKETCNALQAWLKEHISNPYPNATQRLMLAKQHGLTLGQLKNWFANARRRLRNDTPDECPAETLRQKQRQGKAAEDATPSVNQSEETLPLPSSGAQLEEPLSLDTTLSPRVLWNNFFNYPGASSLIGGPQFAPFVATRPPYQLPWLPNVRLYSVLSTFPAGVNLQAPVCWNSPTWQGYEECIQSIQNEE